MTESNRVNYLDLLTPASTEIGTAIKVDDPEGFAWDDECDMLVLGAGLAGSTAALKGAEIGGMDIVLVDRFLSGGTSALSGGVVYAGGGTRVQRDANIEDSIEGLAEYLACEVQGLRSPETIQRFAQSSPAMIDWLTSKGACFGGPVFKSKASYPPPEYFLYYSGNEKAPAYAGSRPPAPRGHRTKSADATQNVTHSSGAVLMAAVGNTIAATPAIRRKFQTTARRLIVDGEGRVIGAELWKLDPESAEAAKHLRLYAQSRNPRLSVFGLTKGFWKKLTGIERRHATPLRVRARGGVVIATGGFGHNAEMVARAAPIYKGARTIGSVGDDGSAVRLGQTVGARLGQMHVLSPWRFISPPFSWLQGVIVSGRGERIVNEELYGARLGGAVFEKGQGEAWLITDSRVQEGARRDLKSPAIWKFQKFPIKVAMFNSKKASNISRLEKKIGVPKGALANTISRYNRDIAESRNDAFQKSPEFRKQLVDGPFYAMNIGAKTRLNPIGSITLGGLEVDEHTNAVLNEARKPISGLFAAGRAAVGICSTNYVSGLSLADCVWSGWQSATAIAGNMGKI
jgi:3-oxo-5alpha-steroid 4-dehydrogenase